MTIFDQKIKVEFNSHGGVVLHTDKGVIWNTLNSKWRIGYGEEGLRNGIFNSPTEAYMEVK